MRLGLNKCDKLRVRQRARRRESKREKERQRVLERDTATGRLQSNWPNGISSKTQKRDRIQKAARLTH